MSTPGEPSTLTVWMNGELYDDPDQARLAVTDHGIVVGDGVFEALKVTEGGAFAITRHIRRMERSAQALGLPQPDAEAVRAGLAAVIDGRTYPFGKVRITYTGGPEPSGPRPPV